MPADSEHRDGVDGKHPGIGELDLNLVESRVGMLGQLSTQESLADDVLDDVDEGDIAGPALDGVHPVPCPGVVDDIGFAANGDVDAVEGVVGEGQEDEADFQHANQGQAVEEFDLGTVGGGAFERLKVGEQVLDQEGTDGHNAGEGVELAQQEGVSLTGAKGRNTAANGGGRLAASGTYGGCHGL